MDFLTTGAGILLLCLFAAFALLLLGALLMKKNGICPICIFRKVFLRPKKVSGEASLPPYGNGAAKTPPMGWSSWNAFREKIDEGIIRDTAAVMRDAGLIEAGYTYLNLDDCWHSSLRDEEGRLQGDLSNFPSGISQLVKDVNAMGMKLGLYTSNGTLTCEDLPASLGKEEMDAKTFAEWGVEFFKYDFCHNIPLPSKAPLIEKITIGKAGDAAVSEFLCTQAELLGLARVMRDKRLPTGHYVTGLDANLGAMEFLVPCDVAGEYILTLCIKKIGVKDKYLSVCVNGESTYETTLPGTHSWSPTGRHQMRVELEKGQNRLRLYNPIGTRADSARIQYTRMGMALKNAAKQQAAATGLPEKPIVYSICEWGKNQPWLWGKSAGNLWRTNLDIFPYWISIIGIYTRTVGKYLSAGPGAWNDPDMLEVGNGKLTEAENRAHFTLWCMMAAPLILGSDLRLLRRPDGSINQNDPVLKIVTNESLLKIDQDPLGKPCKRLRHGRIDVLARPLADGGTALCIVNKWGGAGKSKVPFSLLQKDPYIGLPLSEAYQLEDLWSGETMKCGSFLAVSLPRHSAKLYKITGSKESMKYM